MAQRLVYDVSITFRNLLDSYLALPPFARSVVVTEGGCLIMWDQGSIEIPGHEERCEVRRNLVAIPLDLIRFFTAEPRWVEDDATP